MANPIPKIKKIVSEVPCMREIQERIISLRVGNRSRSCFLRGHIMSRHVLLFVLSLTIIACAQTPIRRLPVADEMPAKPAGADAIIPPGDFVSFYPRAAALTASPPKLARFGIECSVSTAWGYFTLARTEDGRAALFVLTKKGPVTDVAKVISFDKIIPIGGAPMPNYDWGFLYDRNGDGWVDYLVFLEGAHPVKTEEISGLIPKKPGAKFGDPIKISSRGEMELIIDHFQLVFTHNADDNFDGKSDGVVAALRDTENPNWIYGNGVMRSRAFTQEVDEDWRFVTDIGTRAGSVPRTPKGFEVTFFSGERPLETSSELLDAVNACVRACRIPKGALPRE
jgi:hypothetical protein